MTPEEFMQIAQLRGAEPGPVTANPNLLRQGERARAQPRVDRELEFLREPLPMEGRASFLPFMVDPQTREKSWALPGIAAGAVNAFTAPGRAWRGDPVGADEALNVAGGLLAGGAPFAPIGKGNVGITAWHGSPHKFDKFDSSKIGTGEGAQAYGHGLYLAESPKVARDYQKNIAGQSAVVGGKKYDPTSPEGLAVQMIKSHGSADAARQALLENQKAGNFWWGSKQGDDFVLAALDSMPGATKKSVSMKNEGHLYKVDLPDEHIAKMLDWDKPLSQQPEAVKALAERLQGTAAGDALGAYNGKFSTNALVGSRQYGTKQGEATGADLYNALAAAPGSNRSAGAMGPDAATKLFRELGIPGIRYLDAGSRTWTPPRIESGPKGHTVFWGNDPSPVGTYKTKAEAETAAKSLDTRSRNFVVFDDQIPKILSRE